MPTGGQGLGTSDRVRNVIPDHDDYYDHRDVCYDRGRRSRYDGRHYRVPIFRVSLHRDDAPNREDGNFRDPWCRECDHEPRGPIREPRIRVDYRVEPNY